MTLLTMIKFEASKQWVISLQKEKPLQRIMFTFAMCDRKNINGDSAAACT